MEAWRAELRGMFVDYPGSAERILRALDDGKFNGGLCTKCAYGHALQLPEGDGGEAIELVRVSRGLKVYEATPLETFVAWIGPLANRIDHERAAELRAECVAWLADHGTATEPVYRAVEPEHAA